MNLFSTNLTKLQHIRQKNQAQEIQRKIQEDLEFLKELMTRPQSEQSENQFISRANSIPFKDQDFMMEDYVDKYFEELQQRNEQMNQRITNSSSRKNKLLSQSPQENKGEIRMQNRQKLRSTSLVQEKERLQLGEVYRLQDKIGEIMEENQKKKNKLLRRVLSESDFYGIQKQHFRNYQFVKIKNPNPQMCDYLDKSTLMIDEMGSSYKYIYKLSKKFCNIDREMTEKVSQKMKDTKKLKQQQEEQQISQRVLVNPFSKKVRNDSILNQLINYKPADPIHRKLQIQKKLSDFNLKRRQESFDNVQRQKLTRVNSEYTPSTNSFTKLNQTTNASSCQESQYPLKIDKGDQIQTEPDQVNEQYNSERQQQKKRSISTKSQFLSQESTPQKHFLQRINTNTMQKFLVKSSSFYQKNNQTTPNTNENVQLNNPQVQHYKQDIQFDKKIKQFSQKRNSQNDKLKSVASSSFLQTVKNIDLSQSFQFNTLKPKNEIVYNQKDREQKLASTTVKDSPLKLYTLFQNQNLRQKIQQQNSDGKPRYLKQSIGECNDIKIPKYLQSKPNFAQKQQNENEINKQEQQQDQNFEQVKEKRKSIDEQTLLKIRNDNDFKALIIKIIVRENIDIKEVFERNYTLNLNQRELQESLKFFTKFIMKYEESISTTQLYETLKLIFDYKNDISPKQSQVIGQTNADIPLNIVKQIIVKFPGSINNKLKETQIQEFLSKDVQILQWIKDSLYL